MLDFYNETFKLITNEEEVILESKHFNQDISDLINEKHK
jgi:hypothetical protein